jgi:hypothetical protein
MRRILICGGVLGGGTAIVFAAAGVTSLLLPPSRIVPQSPARILDSTMPANMIVAPAVGPQADGLVEVPAPTSEENP